MVKIKKHITWVTVFLIFFLIKNQSFSNNSNRIVSEDTTKTELTITEERPAVKLQTHPRMFFPRGEENRLLELAESNELLSDLIGILKSEAEKKLKLPLQEYTSDGKLLHVAREQISRMITLSMAYRLFKDERYAEKVEKELLNVCIFPNWSPSHFLDVAEMTTAVSIGYDWCYDFLSLKTLGTVENAILEKAIAPARPIYKREGKTAFNRENNWNTVCNAGMVNGAVVLGDKYPEILDSIVNYAVKYTPNVFESFGPDGVFNEGPGYWAYNAMYMSILFDNLVRIFQNDFGLSSFEGMDNTARYYIEQVGPSKLTFNFGDASESVDKSGTFFYLSRLYQQPDVALYYRNLIHTIIREYQLEESPGLPRFFFLAIPWFDNSEPDTHLNDKKLNVFEGVTDLLVFNGSDRSDPDRLYLIAKTGRPSWSHNQLDVGSFVVDSEGERWGIDMGADSYSLPDFWDYKPGGGRWNYFRNTNMAHNTISIDGKITNSEGQGELVAYNSENTQPFGIIDMSKAYEGQANSLRRGFRLISERSILIRDEIDLKKGNEKVSWRFFTDADVIINNNTAVLLKNNKKFYIKCILPDGFQMKVIPAEPFSSKEKPIYNVKIVEIELTAKSKSISIPVLLTSNPDEFYDHQIIDIDMMKWK